MDKSIVSPFLTHGVCNNIFGGSHLQGGQNSIRFPTDFAHYRYSKTKVGSTGLRVVGA